MTSDLKRIFNEGCDARLRGEPQSANPYYIDPSSWWQWRQGWREVDQHYGELARWPIRKLPEVRVAV